ncbi:hypothetical protein PPL_00231 [Heterostelium album PN500]|uniref:FNIP repeat-containing protein n=1 Tax=Heterostelium pallidum (strain ATCC 26659 / Pp 5 / PN500) TaxID=670386 RepID=D3AVW6_HETP5|nr:hypothetical protein PPL_00231 [Heterostelium album PN500]EFA86439.1 hypothetical protein PPL_00231 [Heterostelium album PN500]|eukprot:XP_020438544.1 hypothetical protein PPL_00231 [Heterostelium album PN500]
MLTLTNISLKIIFESLNDSPLDQICFAFSCKKIYNEKSNYLLPTDHSLVNSSNKSRPVSVANWSTLVGNSDHLDLTLELIERSDFAIKDCVSSLKFVWAFAKPLPSTFVIPNHITKLDLAGLINQDIKIGFLPSNLQYLDLSGIRFKSSIEPGLIPESVTKLILPYQYNIPLKPGVIGANVRHLEFGFFYNHPLKESIIPDGVEEIEFGNDFNQPLEYLPWSLKRLKLGGSFNQSIAQEKSLPEGLEQLIFGYHFNQPIPIGCLPPNLRILTFGCNFNQPIVPAGSIPRQIERLEFGYNFNHPIPRDSIPSTRLYFNSIPANVEYLSLGSSFKQRLLLYPIIIGNHRSLLLNENQLLANCSTSFTTPTNISSQQPLLPIQLKELAFGVSLLQQNKFINLQQSITTFTLLLSQPLKARRFNQRSILLMINF